MGWGVGEDVRVGIDFVEEAAAVVFVEDAGEAPWLFLEGLHVLDLDYEDVSWFCGLDFEWAGQIVDFGQVDVFHVICTVVVADLSSCPIYTLDLDDFAALDLCGEGNCRRGQWMTSNEEHALRTVWVPSVLRNISRILLKLQLVRQHT